MHVSLIFLLIAVLILTWDYKFSRASKVLYQLKTKEPDVYNKVYGKTILPPSSSISDIVTRGLYLKIQTPSLKEEVLAINKISNKYALWPYALLVGYIFLILIVGVINRG